MIDHTTITLTIDVGPSASTSQMAQLQQIADEFCAIVEARVAGQFGLTKMPEPVVVERKGWWKR